MVISDCCTGQLLDKSPKDWTKGYAKATVSAIRTANISDHIREMLAENYGKLQENDPKDLKEPNYSNEMEGLGIAEVYLHVLIYLKSKA